MPTPVQAPEFHRYKRHVSGQLHRRINRRAAPPAFDPLLHVDRPPVELDFVPRRDLEAMHFALALLAECAELPLALHFCCLVQRLDIRRTGRIRALPRAELVELVVAPEQDVAAPIRIVLSEILGRAAGIRGDDDGRDVVHYGSSVSSADGHVREADGDDGGGRLVVLVEAGEGGEFGGRGLEVGPAAVTQLAGESEAEAPNIGLDAGGGGGGAGDGLGGFDGEEGGVAAGEYGGDGGLLGGAGVEALGGEERGRVDEGGFGVEVEAELAGRVLRGLDGMFV